MKNNNIYIILVLLITTLGCTNKNADLVVINAKIYTASENNFVAKSLVVNNGKIIEVSNNNLDSKYNTDKIIDVEDRTILPGLIDSHCHFYNLGLDQQVVDLRGTNSFEEIIDRLKKYDLKNDSDVILGRGWDQNDWDIKKFPINTELNKNFKDKLVVLERIDGHAYIVNDNALELAGIDEKTLVRGGLVLLKNNKPTGVLIDGPMSMIDQVLPEKTISEKVKALKKAEEISFSYGLTTVDDAGLNTGIISIIDSLHKLNELKIKIYAMVSVSKNNIEKFKKSINSSQIIFVLGGDTLYLMYHLKKSKMDKLIKERIKNKKALYIGCSAGSIITGNTIAPTMFLRQNKTKKQKKYLVNTYKKKYWKNKKNIKALGLFNNKNVIPHCNSRYLRLKNKLEKNLNKKTKKNICLNENQIGILS